MENPQSQFPEPSDHVRSMAVASAELWQDVLDRLAQVQASQAVVEQNQARLTQAVEQLTNLLGAALPQLDLGQLAPQLPGALPASLAAAPGPPAPTEVTALPRTQPTPPDAAPFPQQDILASVLDEPKVSDALAQVGASPPPGPSWTAESFPEVPTITEEQTADAFLTAEFGSFAVVGASADDEILHDLLGDDFSVVGATASLQAPDISVGPDPHLHVPTPDIVTSPSTTGNGFAVAAPPPPAGFEMPASAPAFGASVPAPDDSPPSSDIGFSAPPPPAGFEMPASAPAFGASVPAPDDSAAGSVGLPPVDHPTDNHTEPPEGGDYSSTLAMAHDILATSAASSPSDASNHAADADAPITPDFFTAAAHGEKTGGWRRIRFGH